ncbi:hypothetical protein KQX54_020155 [Cotesia glomerata]|uniref:Uncharacterized protein n=1 Tax=Cotesia glomerata TaxID=32391 RepID=A0AAV7I331_COTGL|nr:hypothetical protein KQX54_020155 [Cotesia glomerata]
MIVVNYNAVAITKHTPTFTCINNFYKLLSSTWCLKGPFISTGISCLTTISYPGPGGHEEELLTMIPLNSRPPGRRGNQSAGHWALTVSTLRTRGRNDIRLAELPGGRENIPKYRIEGKYKKKKVYVELPSKKIRGWPYHCALYTENDGQEREREEEKSVAYSFARTLQRVVAG